MCKRSGGRLGGLWKSSSDQGRCRISILLLGVPSACVLCIYSIFFALKHRILAEMLLICGHHHLVAWGFLSCCLGPMAPCHRIVRPQPTTSHCSWGAQTSAPLLQTSPWHSRRRRKPCSTIRFTLTSPPGARWGGPGTALQGGGRDHPHRPPPPPP